MNNKLDFPFSSAHFIFINNKKRTHADANKITNKHTQTNKHTHSHTTTLAHTRARARARAHTHIHTHALLQNASELT